MSPLFETLYVDPAQTREIRLALQEAKHDTIPSIKALNAIALKPKNYAFYLDKDDELILIVHTGQNKLPSRHALYIIFKFDPSRRLFRLNCIKETSSWTQLYTGIITENCEKVLSLQQVQTYVEHGRDCFNSTQPGNEISSATEEDEQADYLDLDMEDDTTDDDFCSDIKEEEPATIDNTTDNAAKTDMVDPYALLDYDDDSADDTEADLTLKDKRLKIKKFISSNNEAIRNVLNTINLSSVISTLDMQMAAAQKIIERNIVIEWHNYLTDNFDKKDPADTILINTGILKSDCRPLLILCEMEQKLIRKIILSPSLLQLQNYGLTAKQAINRKVDSLLLRRKFSFDQDSIDYDNMFYISHIQDRHNRLPAELQQSRRRVTENLKYSIDYACQAEALGIDYYKVIRYDTEKDNNAIVIAIPLLYSGRKSDTIIVLRRTELSNFWKIITIENNRMAYLNLRAYNVYDMPLWFDRQA